MNNADVLCHINSYTKRIRQTFILTTRRRIGEELTTAWTSRVVSTCPNFTICRHRQTVVCQRRFKIFVIVLLGISVNYFRVGEKSNWRYDFPHHAESDPHGAFYQNQTTHKIEIGPNRAPKHNAWSSFTLHNNWALKKHSYCIHIISSHHLVCAGLNWVWTGVDLLSSSVQFSSDEVSNVNMA